MCRIHPGCQDLELSKLLDAPCHLRGRPPSPQVIGLSSGGRVAGLAVGGCWNQARARARLVRVIKNQAQNNELCVSLI